MHAPMQERLPGGEIESEPLELTPNRWFWVTEPEPIRCQMDRAELTWLNPRHAPVGYGGWYLVVRDNDGKAIARSGPWPNNPMMLADALREMFPAAENATRDDMAHLEREGAILIENALTERLVRTARQMSESALPGSGSESPATLVHELQVAANARQVWLTGTNVPT